MKRNVHKKDVLYSNEVYFQDTDFLYIQMEKYVELKGAGYGGNKLGQGKNDYEDKVDGFNGLFLASKMIVPNTNVLYGTIRVKWFSEVFIIQKKSANFISWVCFKILFLIFSNCSFFCCSANSAILFEHCSVI